VVFSYVDQRTTFLLSAGFGLVGAALTWLFLPDTTGMSLDELDRWVAGRGGRGGDDRQAGRVGETREGRRVE